MQNSIKFFLTLWCALAVLPVLALTNTNTSDLKAVTGESVSNSVPNPPQTLAKENKKNSQVSGEEAPKPDTQPTPQAKTFSSDPINYRSWFFDGTAAVFGILAIVFALLTVIITVLCIYFGVSKFREIIEKVELDLRAKVDTEFGKRLDELVTQQIEPKVREIIDNQLKTTLDAGKLRIEAEISQSLKDPELREALIKEVAAEIQSRLLTPPSTKVEPKEFGP